MLRRSGVRDNPYENPLDLVIVPSVLSRSGFYKLRLFILVVNVCVFVCLFVCLFVGDSSLYKCSYTVAVLYSAHTARCSLYSTVPLP